MRLNNSNLNGSRRTIYPFSTNQSDDKSSSDDIFPINQNVFLQIETCDETCSICSQLYDLQEELSVIKQLQSEDKNNQGRERASEVIEKYQIEEKGKKHLLFISQLAKVRDILGRAFILQYKQDNNLQNFQSAIKCFKYQYNPIQLNEKRAKRLNNLGYCEMMNNRFSNAFFYFSQAFPIYKTFDGMERAGLYKNLMKVYQKSKMYKEAAIFCDLALKQKEKYDVQESQMIISLLTYINLCESGNQFKKDKYERVKKFLEELEKNQSLFNSLIATRIRLGIIRYGVQSGILNNCITRNQMGTHLDKIMKTPLQDYNFVLIQAQALTLYRNLFKNAIQKKQYHRITQKAKSLYDMIRKQQIPEKKY